MTDPSTAHRSVLPAPGGGGEPVRTPRHDSRTVEERSTRRSATAAADDAQDQAGQDHVVEAGGATTAVVAAPRSPGAGATPPDTGTATHRDPAPAATATTEVPPSSTPLTTGRPAEETAVPSTGAHGHRRHRRRPWAWIITVALLVLLLAGAGYAAVHLYQTSQAWEERSEEYLRASQDLGEELATTEAALTGARAELDAVRAQLTTAQARIVELADEKAQLGDDREVQRQLVDYQQRISAAAGQVALALDQCVQGQNQLIGYMENAAQYDPAELEQFGADVQALCQAATDANAELQRELAP